MRKRLLISIANYGDSQLDYLGRALDNFATYSYETSIVLDTTVDLSSLAEGRENITQRMYPPSVGHTLPFKHREYFAKNISNYDYFLYTENDHLIPQQAVDFIVEASANIEHNEIIGFLRYENDGEMRYMTDQSVAYPVSKFHAWENNKRIFFTPYNLHSGCYLASREQLRRAIASGGYLVEPHTGPYGMLEQGASDIYTQCGFKPKFLPLPIEPVLIHHMPDKYVQMPSAMPFFNVDVLSVLENKLGDKPKLKPASKPHMIFSLVKKLRYEANLLERKFRHRIRGRR